MLMKTSYNKNSDEVILALIHQKKEEGMKKLLNRYFNELFQFAIKLTGNSEDAKDIIQSVFYNLWKFSQVDKIKCLKAYLFKMVKSEVFKLWSERKNITELLEKYNEILIEERDPSDKISSEEFNKKVEDAIRQLPVSCRRIFNLKRTEELSLDEIANRLNISKQTVKNQLTKARTVIKKKIGSEDVLV